MLTNLYLELSSINFGRDTEKRILRGHTKLVVCYGTDISNLRYAAVLKSEVDVIINSISLLFPEMGIRVAEMQLELDADNVETGYLIPAGAGIDFANKAWSDLNLI